MLEAGIQLRRRGRYQEAAAVLKSAARRYPERASLLWFLGGIYLHDLRQPQNALPLYRKATRLAPRSERASLGLFHALWGLDRRREAIKELKRFQSVANCADYVKILAEIRQKAPELFAESPKSKAS